MKKSIGTATLIVAACLGLMPIAPAYAANWVYVTTSTKNADFYYDSDTIQRSGNRVTVWEKVDYSRDKTSKERQSKGQYLYDCAARTNTLLHLTNYYPDGKIETFSWKSYEQEERAIPPDTVTEALLQAVCQ